jgi:hypothetical protein
MVPRKDRTADSFLKSDAMLCGTCILNVVEEPAASIFTTKEAVGNSKMLESMC